MAARPDATGVEEHKGRGKEDEPEDKEASRMATADLHNRSTEGACTKIGDDVLAMPPVSSAPFFFLDAVGRAFEDIWQPYLGGLLRLPQPVYYKAYYQPGETQLVVQGHSAVGTPYLPPSVQEQLDQRGITAYDWAWVISDVSSLVGECGLVLNLSHHAWYFPDELFPEIMSGRRVEVAIKMGAFTYAGSLVAPFPDRVCLPFQTIDALPVTVHPQKGKNLGAGICCSPNNARFSIIPTGDLPISHLWTVAVAEQGGETRAIVTLQWIVYGAVPETGALRGCQSLFEVLQRIQEVFGAERPLVQAAARMFGYGADKGFTSSYGLVTATPPMHKSKNQGSQHNPGGRGGGRGRGRGGSGGGDANRGVIADGSDHGGDEGTGNGRAQGGGRSFSAR